MTLAVNDIAPDFELPSNELDVGKPGKKIKLSDFKGKPVVLAFYPLDFSPTCTTENTCFRDDFEAFHGVGAQVLGISVDSAWTHAAFAKSLNLTFPLLADFHPKGAVASTYGLYLDERGITKRATVIVDRNGKVAWIKEQPIGEARDNRELLDALKQLA
jgi:mycoredoxin-dependent peroxiredoxin